MDTFTDVEAFCDILEAMKRGVSVDLLLDHLYVALFENMCGDLHISCTHLTVSHTKQTSLIQHCALDVVEDHFHSIPKQAVLSSYR